MPQYTTLDIQLWISRANKALYKLGTKSTDERFFENDNSYERERLLIYVLKKAVSWSYLSQYITHEKKNRAVSLLISRISMYDYSRQLPIYNTGSSQFVGLSEDYLSIPSPAPGGGGAAIPDDIVLEGGVDITAGLSSFTDARLSGQRFRIARNGIVFLDWYKSGSTVFLTGVGDQVMNGDVFLIQFY